MYHYKNPIFYHFEMFSFNWTVNIYFCKSTDPPKTVMKPQCTAQYAYVSNFLCAGLVFYDLAENTPKIENI